MREQHAGRASWELVQNTWDEAHNTTRANRITSRSPDSERLLGKPVPLASPTIVSQEGWEEVQRLRARSLERPRRSLSADRLPAETARPPVYGELVTFERHVGAELRPASAPGEPPGQADRGTRPEGRAPSGRFTGAWSTGETASGVRSNALPPTRLNSKTELRP